MRGTRKAIVIVTNARDGLLVNGCAQGMGKIPDARNPHAGCTQSPFPPLFFFLFPPVRWFIIKSQVLTSGRDTSFFLSFLVGESPT